MVPGVSRVAPLKDVLSADKDVSLTKERLRGLTACERCRIKQVAGHVPEPTIHDKAVTWAYMCDTCADIVLGAFKVSS